ncbi:MAG: saccharopine dehydrogenase family protein [Motilibacteraceae bacterium]
MGRVVLFGATGYTGRLTAQALVRRGVVPVLAGRSAGRLQAVAAELAAANAGPGLVPETVELDVSRPWQLAPLLEPDDVLVTTVGPFLTLGRPALAAAIAAGATYVDSTGEPPFVAEVFAEHDVEARRTGARLLPAFGYDYVPGHLAAGLALRDAGAAATAVDIGYFVTGRGRFSTGTLASAVGVLTEPAPVRRDGRLVTERPAAHVRSFEVGGRSRSGVSIGGSEHHALPRSFPQLRDVGVYLGWTDRVSRLAQAGSLGLSLAGRVPGLGSAVRSGMGLATAPLVRRGGGPDELSRAGAGTLVVAEACGAAGDVQARAVVTGPSPYDLTAELLAWAAQQAHEGHVQGTGSLGPVEAFGLDGLEQGCRELGLARTEGL